MKILNIDMDNTLIYSYKHDIGREKINVELYNGREISYITKRTFELLNEIKKRFLIVPTTTRTKQQYERIFLGIGLIKYALVCNGGVLLVDGKPDEDIRVLRRSDHVKLVIQDGRIVKNAMPHTAKA